MAKIVVYDPMHPSVTNCVTEYNPSANTPDYDSEPNKLVNPDLSGVAGVPYTQWKVVGSPPSVVAAMEPADISQMNAPNEEGCTYLNESVDCANSLVDACIRVDRSCGGSPNIDAVLKWNETEDEWQAGLAGATVKISLDGHTHTESEISDLQAYALDSAVVHNTGNETIAGNKVFTGSTRLGHNFSSSYELSVQSNAANAYIEILNSGGAGKGAFFGMENYITANDFALYNWQGGPICFYTDTTASSEQRRLVIQPDGDVEIKNLTAGFVKSAADGTLSSGTITESDITDLQSYALSSHNHDSDYVELTGDTMTGALTVDATVTSDQIVIKHASNSNLDVTIDPNGQHGAAGFSISKGATGGGFMSLMPNSEILQWIAASPSAATGDNTFYFDVDNGGHMRFQTLPGAGRGGDFVVTYDGRCIPGNDGTSDLGTATDRWNDIHGVTIYGDGSNLTGLTESQITDLGNYAVIGGAHHDGFSDFVANEHINHASVSITAGNGLTGGGTIAANRTLNVVGANSITANANDIQLVNDSASPGNNKVYGTNGSGVKGWKDDPSGGSGDVTAASNITDHSVVRGDGGAKGVQDSNAGGSPVCDVTISDECQLSVVASKNHDYALSIQNIAQNGDGFKVRAGENLGDIAFHIADWDNTFQIMEMEADQGYITIGETYAQTLTNNGVVYGLDLQHDGTTSKDINTQHGVYRIAGDPVMHGTHYQFASSDAQSTTIDSGWVEKLKLTTPSLPAGDYRIGYSAQMRNSGSSGGVWRTHLDDTTVLDNGNTVDSSTPSFATSAGGFTVVTLTSGVHTIDFDYSAGKGGTTYIKNCRLEIWRIS